MYQILIKNVLLAEDDEEDVFLFKTVLSELNQDIIVTVAADGNLLMTFLKQATLLPDMIFLDLKNGAELKLLSSLLHLIRNK
jgi:CheY-like chemotaxis protein